MTYCTESKVSPIDILVSVIHDFIEEMGSSNVTLANPTNTATVLIEMIDARLHAGTRGSGSTPGSMPRRD
jgi:hypothetical protein